MNTRNTLACTLLALCSGLAAAPAWADDDCDVPIRLWQPREAVLQMAAREGWEVQRLKIDDGCYEIRGKDAQGRAFKAKLDPQTLGVVRMKRRERDAAALGAPLPPAAPGSAPQGRVE